jgi:hypothetical protein
MLSARQREVLRSVLRATIAETWYRAQGSGERVTLASLFRAGILIRRAWRGAEGEPDAAHEYRVADTILHQLTEPLS